MVDPNDSILPEGEGGDDIIASDEEQLKLLRLIAFQAASPYSPYSDELPPNLSGLLNGLLPTGDTAVDGLNNLYSLDPPDSSADDNPGLS